MSCCNNKNLDNLPSDLSGGDPFVPTGDVEIQGTLQVDGATTLEGEVVCGENIVVAGLVRANGAVGFTNGALGAQGVSIQKNAQYAWTRFQPNTGVYYDIRVDDTTDALEIADNANGTIIQLKDGRVGLGGGASAISSETVKITGNVEITGDISANDIGCDEVSATGAIATLTTITTGGNINIGGSLLGSGAGQDLVLGGNGSFGKNMSIGLNMSVGNVSATGQASSGSLSVSSSSSFGGTATFTADSSASFGGTFGQSRTISTNKNAQYAWNRYVGNPGFFDVRVDSAQDVFEIIGDQASVIPFQQSRNGLIGIGGVATAGNALTITGNTSAVGNIAISQNVSASNAVITGNISCGNASITQNLSASNVVISNFLNLSGSASGAGLGVSSTDLNDFTGYTVGGTYQNIDTRSISQFNSSPAVFTASGDSANGSFFSSNACLTLRNMDVSITPNASNPITIPLRMATTDGGNTVAVGELSSYVYERTTNNFCRSGIALSACVSNQRNGLYGLSKMITIDTANGMYVYPSGFASGSSYPYLHAYDNSGTGSMALDLKTTSSNTNSLILNSQTGGGITIYSNGVPRLSIQKNTGNNASISFENQTLEATAGSLVGYIIVSLNGTDYKIPYYNLT